MKMPGLFQRKNTWLVIGGGLILAAYIFSMRSGLITPPGAPSAEEPADVPQRIAVIGETTCLPKKGPGPHTMECAIGLESETGDFYALDLSVLQTEAGFFLDTAQSIRVEGNLVPLEQISAAQWHTYDIIGIIQVTSLVQSGE